MNSDLNDSKGLDTVQYKNFPFTYTFIKHCIVMCLAYSDIIKYNAV